MAKKSRPKDSLSGLDRLRADVDADPIALAAYSDQVRRSELIDALQNARESIGMRQSDVATAMGTTQSAVSDLESGRSEPRLQTMQRYARAVNQRLDVAITDPSWPAYSEVSARQLWQTIEKRALSPLLTTLATGKKRDRTLERLSQSIDFDTSVVEYLLNSLRRRGWVTGVESKWGELFALGDRAAYVMGLSLERGHIVGVLLDLRAQVIHRREVELYATPPRAVIDAAVNVVRQLYALREDHSVIGVGVSVAGVVTHDTGTIKFAPDLRSEGENWENIHLEAELQERLQGELEEPNLRVVVENDANALATYQYLRHAAAHDGEDDLDSCMAVVLLTAAGVGAGFVFHGHVMYGANSAAGEGGHSMVDPQGTECRAKLGHFGCLESAVSSQAILSRLGLEHDTKSDVRAGLSTVGEMVRNGNEQARSILQDAGRTLGQFIASVITTNDPGRIAIYAFEQLADSTWLSSQYFQAAVERGIATASSKEDGINRQTDLEWNTVAHDTFAVAAGAAVTRKFLYEPYHWAPAVLDPQLAR